MQKAGCASSMSIALALTLTLVQSLAATNAKAGSISPDLFGGIGDLIPWPETIEVQIKNRLESNATLKVYCKDKNDVGEQELGYDSTFSFSYTQTVPEALQKNTVFSCQLKWNNEKHNFDLFKQERDSPTCGTKCGWEIKEKGPCLVHPSRCYPWS